MQAGKSGATATGGTAHTGAAGSNAAGLIKLMVAVIVVFTNEKLVTVDDTTNWFLLMKNRFSLL
jgi:hypothetical protein